LRTAKFHPEVEVTLYVVHVAIDDDAQIDPATLPENVALLAEVDAQLAAAEAYRQRRRALETRLASAIPNAVGRIEERVQARDASPHGKKIFALGSRMSFELAANWS
jgi:hypothetical protein